MNAFFLIRNKTSSLKLIFKSLCRIAKQHIINTGLYNLKLEEPSGVYNRSMFKDELNQF